MKTFITFGQQHIHKIDTPEGEKVFDKDTVGVIEAENEGKARDIAFSLFDDKFGTTYTEGHWKPENIDFFPKGFVKVN